MKDALGPTPTTAQSNSSLVAYRERRKLNFKTGRDIVTLELVEDGHLPDTAGNYLVGLVTSTISLPPNNNNLAAKNIRVATGRVNRSQGGKPRPHCHPGRWRRPG